MNFATSSEGFDDFSQTWTRNPEEYWTQCLYDTIPTGNSNPGRKDSEKGDYDDGNGDSKLGRLSRGIDRAARDTYFYQQSALQLADQCRVLVNGLEWSLERMARQKKPGKMVDASYQSTFKLMCESSLEKDLARVLALLQSFGNKPTQYFQDLSKFPHVFTNAIRFLMFDRPFLKHNSEVVNQVETRLVEAIRYDQRDLEREVAKSPSRAAPPPAPPKPAPRPISKPPPPPPPAASPPSPSPPSPASPVSPPASDRRSTNHRTKHSKSSSVKSLPSLPPTPRGWGAFEDASQYRR